MKKAISLLLALFQLCKMRNREPFVAPCLLCFQKALVFVGGGAADLAGISKNKPIHPDGFVFLLDRFEKQMRRQFLEKQRYV